MIKARTIALWLAAVVATTATLARAAGAKTPFVTLEAEAGELAGGAKVHAFTLGSTVPTKATLELEASGGAYVRLDGTGQSISWHNAVDGANTIVVRNSMPDTKQGGGYVAGLNLYIDGKFRQTLQLSNKQSWIYRTKREGWLDDPNRGGMPFKFYNEDRTFITGAPLMRGSVITLQKEAQNTAAEYNIDCIDMEAAPPPLSRPAGSLSVLDYGAAANSEVDCQKSIQRCVDDARRQHKSVWIPPGRYKISSVDNTALELAGVEVHGAGVWYTTLYHAVPAHWEGKWRWNIRVGSHTTLTDVFIDANSVRRGIGQPGGSDYGVLAFGDGWLVQHIWVQHCDADWMSGSNGVIRDCRVADSWGDGINLNNGNHPSPDTVGQHLTAENNFVRGTGDDGLATYSDAGAAGNNSQMVGSTFLNNTSIATYWANALRVAGGKGVVIRGNLLCDPSSNNGMDLSTYGLTGQPLESADVEGNVIRRGGGWNGTDRHGLAIGSPPNHFTKVTVRDNIIEDSRRAGVYVSPSMDQVILENNKIINPATTGILIAPNVTGTGRFPGNLITGLHSGNVPIDNKSSKSFVVEK